MTIVCADCGCETGMDEFFSVPGDECGSKDVCPHCAQKYGYNLDDNDLANRKNIINHLHSIRRG